MKRFGVLDVPIAEVDMRAAAEQIDQWIESGEQTYVTVTGVHGVMESQRDTDLRSIHQKAGMCVPDGMPMVWVGRLTGHSKIRRVYGPDLMLEICKRSVARGHTHFLYGGKDGVADRLADRLRQMFPGLKIVGTYTPPFRPLTEQEETDLTKQVEDAAPDILWVGLSTPKQERWMAEHVGRLNTRVMLGVGAAFDMNAGLLKQAPNWMQSTGLEWLYRLIQEPKRLGPRYLTNNPKFIVNIMGQFLGIRGGRLDDGSSVGSASAHREEVQ